MKERKLIITGSEMSLRSDNKYIEVLDSFWLFRLIINSEGTSSQQTCHRLAYGRGGINDVEKISDIITCVYKDQSCAENSFPHDTLWRWQLNFEESK